MCAPALSRKPALRLRAPASATTAGVRPQVSRGAVPTDRVFWPAGGDETVGWVTRRVLSHLGTDNISQVPAVADRIWVLRAGRLVAHMAAEETNHAEIVEHITGMTRPGAREPS